MQVAEKNLTNRLKIFNMGTFHWKAKDLVLLKTDYQIDFAFYFSHPTNANKN